MPVRVLVTGGAGFIGSHACKALAAAGFEPVVFDDLSQGRVEAVRWGPLVRADLADRAAIAAAIGTYRVQAVMHFAGSIEVGRSAHDPGAFYRNNVVNSINLLDAAAAAGVRAVVFSSTAAVYGVPGTVPIPETHRQQPINAYGDTKLAIERALRWYGQAHGVRWAALRYFNAAGADPDGELGECHEPETHLIPLAIGAGLGTHPPVTVFGTDYDTPDGTAVRDYIHVRDLVEAHVLALRRLLDGGDNLLLNLGTGEGVSVRRALDTISAILNRPVPHTLGPRRAGDPPVLVADPGAAMATLGWRPALSNLETIVRTALQWHRAALQDRPPA